MTESLQNISPSSEDNPSSNLGPEEATSNNSLKEKELKAEIEKLIAEKEEYLAGWKRAKADFINYQKEELKRLEEITKFGQMDLLRDLIIVLDSFDLGLEALEKEGVAVRGMYMIRTQLEDVLRKRGLERIMISVGQPFDPALHEAVAEVESSLKPGTVVEEVRRGYMLHGKVIRPAQVKIAKF